MPDVDVLPPTVPVGVTRSPFCRPSTVASVVGTVAPYTMLAVMPVEAIEGDSR